MPEEERRIPIPLETSPGRLPPVTGGLLPKDFLLLQGLTQEFKASGVLREDLQGEPLPQDKDEVRAMVSEATSLAHSEKEDNEACYDADYDPSLTLGEEKPWRPEALDFS